MALLGRINPEQESENLRAFARYIIASPARFVFLLEVDHQTTLYAEKLMLDRETSSVLWQAGFKDYFSEKDASGRAVSQAHMKKMGEALSLDKDILEDQILSSQSLDMPKLHLVGSDATTAEEVRLAARGRLNRSKLLTELLWTIPQAQASKIPGEEPHIFLGAAMADAEKAAKTVIKGCNDVLAYRRALSAAGGIEQLRAQLIEELDIMQDLLIRYRVDGKADEESARKILDIAKRSKGRAIINYGVGHGMYANNPMSLPDQLAKQGTNRHMPDVTAHIILMMDSKHALGFLRTTEEEYRTENVDMPLRGSVMVYDIGLQQEWPIHQWFEQALSIYADHVVSPREEPSLS